MSIPEIRHVRIDTTGLTAKEIMNKYEVLPGRAYRAAKKGFFIKNSMTPEIIIDPSNFDVDYAYNLAGKVFWKNFSYLSGAIELMPDMIQEAVKRQYELSGKLDEMANEKYNKSYQLHFVSHNAMLGFFKKYNKTNRVVEKCRAVLQQYPVFQQKLMGDNTDEIDLGNLPYVTA